MALPHAKPAQVISLEAVRTSPASLKSSAIVKTPEFEAIHLIVAEGREIASHSVEGPITLYCLEGHVKFILNDSTVDLKHGEWLFLEGGEAHAVLGLKSSRLLLTIISNATNASQNSDFR